MNSRPLFSISTDLVRRFPRQHTTLPLDPHYRLSRDAVDDRRSRLDCRLPSGARDEGLALSNSPPPWWFRSRDPSDAFHRVSDSGLRCINLTIRRSVGQPHTTRPPGSQRHTALLSISLSVSSIAKQSLSPRTTINGLQSEGVAAAEAAAKGREAETTTARTAAMPPVGQILASANQNSYPPRRAAPGRRASRQRLPQSMQLGGGMGRGRLKSQQTPLRNLIRQILLRRSSLL